MSQQLQFMLPGGNVYFRLRLDLKEWLICVARSKNNRDDGEQEFISLTNLYVGHGACDEMLPFIYVQHRRVMSLQDAWALAKEHHKVAVANWWEDESEWRVNVFYGLFQ